MIRDHPFYLIIILLILFILTVLLILLLQYLVNILPESPTTMRDLTNYSGVLS